MKDHPDIKFGKTGILIINLGTPDSTKWWDIRKYLMSFYRQKSYRSKSYYMEDNIKFIYFNI